MEGNDGLTASHRALITDVADKVFMLTENHRSFGINFKYIEKIRPSQIIGFYYYYTVVITIFFGPKEPSSSKTYMQNY